MKFATALAATTGFLLLLVLVYYVHSQYLMVDVVLYSALWDVAVACAVAAIALVLIPWFRPLDGFEKFQLVAIWLLLGYALAISIPTVIDRSLSFYILEKLQQRGGGIRLDSFEQVFAEEYMKEHRLVDVRLTEQQESGTIDIIDGCVVLTQRGQRLARLSRYFRKQLLPRHRLLRGKYSDELTDPFRNGEHLFAYECRPRGVNWPAPAEPPAVPAMRRPAQ